MVIGESRVKTVRMYSLLTKRGQVYYQIYLEAILNKCERYGQWCSFSINLYEQSKFLNRNIYFI